MIPPMSRSRSWRATSSAASRLLRKTVSSRFDLPTFLPGVDVDHRERLGALDDERPARREPHLAVERLEQLLGDVEALEDREPLLLGVVELDPIGELGRDRLDVAAGLLVERAVVDDDAAVLLGELLADEPQHEVGLLVEELRLLRLVGQRRDLLPLVAEAADVALELVLRRALGRGAHDEPGVGRPDAVEHLAEALALVVGEALRDAVGVGLARHHHEEAAGEAHLLGEARALVGDRVLGDLHGDHLPVLEHALDLGLVAALDVGLVERDVAAVEHAVLGRADVDERGLHAGEHVLHPAEVDVAVDRLVARGRGQRVLDQAAALEHRDVGVTAFEHVDAHEVPAGRAALPGAAPAAFEDVVVERGGRCLADPEVGAHDVVAARLRLLAAAAAAGVPARCRPGSRSRCRRRRRRRGRGRGRRADDGAWVRAGSPLARRRAAGRGGGRAGASRRSGAWARAASRRRGAGRCGSGPPLRARRRRRRRWSGRGRRRRRCSRDRG